MLLRKGKVRLNGKKMQNNQRLLADDVLTFPKDITIASDSSNSAEQSAPAANTRLDEWIKQAIIYEDANIIAINKKQGVPVQGGTGIKYSIAEAITKLSAHYKIVHRLDKQTSGVMLIAKNLPIARLLGKMFKEKTIIKRYLAIIAFPLPKQHGMIKVPLIKGQNREIELMVRAQNAGPADIAITRYQIVQTIESGYTLVQLEPITGKKHQLRAHLAIRECPIIGDTKYGGEKDAYLYLHAKSIEFKIADKKYNIETPLPNHFIEKLKTLGFSVEIANI